MALFDFLLVPLVGHTGESARFVDGLTGFGGSVPKDEERCGRSNKDVLEHHGYPRLRKRFAAAAIYRIFLVLFNNGRRLTEAEDTLFYEYTP
jgi:hypothetical protein